MFEESCDVVLQADLAAVFISAIDRARITRAMTHSRQRTVSRTLLILLRAHHRTSLALCAHVHRWDMLIWYAYNMTGWPTDVKMLCFDGTGLLWAFKWHSTES